MVLGASQKWKNRAVVGWVGDPLVVVPVRSEFQRTCGNVIPREASWCWDLFMKNRSQLVLTAYYTVVGVLWKCTPCHFDICEMFRGHMWASEKNRCASQPTEMGTH